MFPFVRRSLAVGAVLTMAAVAVPAGVGSADSGVDGRVVAAGPSTDLGTQVVTVSWTGFRPTRRSTGQYTVNVVQCRENPTSLADCFMNQAFPNADDGNQVTGAITAADGTGKVNFEVRSALDLPELGCSSTRACSLLAYENTGTPIVPGSLPSAYAITTIRFAPSIADCPTVSDFDVRTGGSASAIPLLYRVASTRCTGGDPVIMDVTESSSNEGRLAVLEEQVDFGITSLPFTAAELAAHPSTSRVRYAPIDLTAVTVVHNLRNPTTGQAITDLVLSPRLVARIVSDSRLDTFYSDPELRELNPGVRWPAFAPSQPLVRAEANADTTILTTWLQEDATARAFLDGADPRGIEVNSAWRGIPYPTDTFESRSATGSYLPRTGQREVARRVFYGVRPADGATTSPDYYGFIGVVDLPTARRYGLPAARIVNRAGVAVAPDDASIRAGFAAMRTTAGGTLEPNPAATDPAAYPLVKVDYAVVTDRLRTDRSADVATVLTDLTTTAQAALPDGYVPLPDSLRQQAAQVVSGLGALISGIDPGAAPASFGGTDSTVTYPVSSTAYDVPVESTTAAGPAGPGTNTIRRRGLVRFQPIVATAPPRGVAAPQILAAIGLLAALGAAAPSLVRRLRRPTSA
jgi:ABC-type phosphate transport system substrate-binding protein